VLDVLIGVHLLNFYTIVLSGLIGAIWGVQLIWRRRPMSDEFRFVLYTIAGFGVAQALIGGILFLTGCRPNDNLHLVYGLIALVGIPIAFTYTSESLTRRDILVLAFAAFAIAAAALRAYSTGVGGTCPA
jgi:heme A synthase